MAVVRQNCTLWLAFQSDILSAVVWSGHSGNETEYCEFNTFININIYSNIHHRWTLKVCVCVCVNIFINIHHKYKIFYNHPGD